MKHYLYHRPDGVIQFTGNCPDSATPAPEPGLTLLMLDAPLVGRNWHVESGQVVPGALDLRTLDERKADKWAQIKTARDEAEATTFPYQGVLFDCDPRSVQRINTAVQAAQAALQAGQPFAIEWTAYDNTSVPVDALAMIGMPVALAMHANALHEQAKVLRAQIETATTPEAVEAITWPVT